MGMAYRQLLECSGRSISCKGGIISYTRNGGNLLRQVSHRKIINIEDQVTLGLALESYP